MDVEGTENKVIAGMPSILQNTGKLKMMAEFTPYLIKKSGINPEEFLQSFTNNKFDIYLLNKRKKKMEHITVTELLTRFPPEKQINMNLL